MLKYGIELEGFFSDGPEKPVRIPDKILPTDGNPGLVEVRTAGGHTSLWIAYAIITAEKERLQYTARGYIRTDLCEHRYDRESLRELRSRQFEKRQWDIQNLYDKKPRYLNNKTIASCQLNVSCCVREEYTDKSGITHPAVYTLVDIPKIVKALDKEFEVEILFSKRQKGEYCIKGDRLEYRSLPNFAFNPSFVPRVLKALHE